MSYERFPQAMDHEVLIAVPSPWGGEADAEIL